MPYLRAWDDRLRFYPGGVVELDGTWTPSPDGLSPSLGADKAGARLAVRRLRLELSGDFSRLFAFTAGVEMGGQRIGQTKYQGSTTPRWAPADVHDGVVRPGEANISFTPWHALSFTAGQVYAPFSLENRTREEVSPFLAQPIAIRGFAVPYDKAVGAMAWGEIAKRMFAYEIGAFDGSSNEPMAAGSVDAEARMFARPFAHAGKGVFFELAQIGVSARYGYRDPSVFTADFPTISSGNGYVLWQPGYVDSQGRVTHVIASGAQRAIGGELRLPVRTPTKAVFDLRGEAYYVRNDTREAIDGFQRTNSERFGRVEGASWYASLAWWACFIPGFDQLVTGEPGVVRPRSIDNRGGAAFANGLDVSLLAGGIHANYRGASRLGSTSDSLTPASDILVYQFGGAIQYWLGANVRASFDYMAYVAPGSGTNGEAVVLPDNLPKASGSVGTGHVLHEIGLRLGAAL